MTVPNEVFERLALLEAQVRYLSDRMQLPLPDFRTLASAPVPDEVRRLVAAGDKLAAIKAYREATGSDLSTAKKVVDSL